MDYYYIKKFLIMPKCLRMGLIAYRQFSYPTKDILNIARREILRRPSMKRHEMRGSYIIYSRQ